MTAQKQDFVLDCSVAVSWCFLDEHSQYARSVLQNMLNSTAHVPALWPFEVSNVLSTAERHKRIGRADVEQSLYLLQHMSIEVSESNMSDIFSNALSLAREFQLTAYDAAYLDLALRHGWPLATLDKQLVGAAKKAGVELL